MHGLGTETGCHSTTRRACSQSSTSIPTGFPSFKDWVLGLAWGSSCIHFMFASLILTFTILLVIISKSWYTFLRWWSCLAYYRPLLLYNCITSTYPFSTGLFPEVHHRGSASCRLGWPTRIYFFVSAKVLAIRTIEEFHWGWFVSLFRFEMVQPCSNDEFFTNNRSYVHQPCAMTIDLRFYCLRTFLLRGNSRESVAFYAFFFFLRGSSAPQSYKTMPGRFPVLQDITPSRIFFRLSFWKQNNIFISFWDCTSYHI